MTREIMEYDVVIVGGGPAGLSAAIRLAQMAKDNNFPVRICIIEKGAEIGAHILSGAVFEPRALNELMPDWKQRQAPLNTPVSADQFLFLTKNKSWRWPTGLLPKTMHNAGNYIISLGNLCRWLAQQAEELGVEIYPGFAAAEVLYHDNGAVKGIATGNMGVGKEGQQKANFSTGIELHAKYVFFAEGCRGSLSQQIIKKFNLRDNIDPPTYGLGIKELWEIDPAKHQAGLVQHTAGWPLDNKTYGGSFIYHLENNQVSIGFIMALDYENPYLDPYEEMQRFKLHPVIKPLLVGGKRISYGARALNEGGLQSLPKLVFPGGALVGCAPGFLNVAKIKGSHTAMKSGMLAAEAAFNALKDGSTGQDELTAYSMNVKSSWLYKELYQARNFRHYFRYGFWLGTLLAGIDLKLLGGKTCWTLHNKKEDSLCMQAKSKYQPIDYPKPDNNITFDRLSSVYLSNTHHEEDQPVHLHLQDINVPISVNLAQYDAPEQRYCPAGVYEIIDKDGQSYLQINGQNCVHCKTCDIKDPTGNITWLVPEGGGGPNYPNM